MDKGLRVLLVEDSEDDAILVLRELRQDGCEVYFKRVDTAQGMREALANESWDLVIADHSMPHFNALAALKELRRINLDIPFIIVSGSIGDEIAVGAMQAGAQDYLLKSNLKRLYPAVVRELRESEDRRARRQAEQSLEIERKKLKGILETMENGVYIVNREFDIEFINPMTLKDFGPVQGKKCYHYFHDRNSVCPWCHDAEVFSGTTVRYEGYYQKSAKFYDIFSTPLYNEDGSVSKLHISNDITAHKQTESNLILSLEQLRHSLEGSIKAMSSTIEVKDPYTAGHQQRVSQLACAISNRMNLPQDQIEGIRLAACIHDLGKISIPSEILSKPGKLNEIEFMMIKAHPQIGYEILRTIDFPWPISQVVLQHHERNNGSGFPNGLFENQILLEAKILGVADVVEAMASYRPYRPALGIDAALGEITNNSGVLYDKDIVLTCTKLFKDQEFKFED